MIIKPQNECVSQCRVDCDRDDISPAFTAGYLSPDAVSNLLVRNMKALVLTSAEIVFLEYLMSHGFSWEADCSVSPSLKEMHRATGLATGTIHAAKKGLVAKGFIKILNERNKQRTNTYNFMPLREKLEEFARRRLPATPERKVDNEEISHAP
jgi:DNA-binding MarR family transcriptional regulator